MSFDLVFVFPGISGLTDVCDHYTVPIRGDVSSISVGILIYRRSWGVARCAGGMLDMVCRKLGRALRAFSRSLVNSKELSNPSCARRHGQVLAC